MDAITDIQLFKVLKKKLGEKEAEELVSFVRSTIDAKLYAIIIHKICLTYEKNYIFFIYS